MRFWRLGVWVLLVPQAALASLQEPREWRVSVSRPISAPPSRETESRHLETWLAVDPRAPDRMLATAIVVGSDGSAVYRSADGGITWDRSRPPGGEDVFPGVDPMLVFGWGGEAWLSTIDPRPGRGPWGRNPTRNFYLCRSRDGGRSWTRLPDVPGGIYDRQFLAVDSVQGATRLYAMGKVGTTVLGAPRFPGRDALSLTWSDDGGDVFRSPRFTLPPPRTDSCSTRAGSRS